MPRTPKLSLLGTLSPRVGRRTFLRGVAAGAAALAAGRPSAARANAPSVAIVGAGIAGLCAALTLRDRGVTPTVFDASHRIGGRMHSEATFWGEGQVSEYCGELIDTDHLTIRSLAKRFGLALDDINAAHPPGSTSVQYFQDRYVPYAELQRAFTPLFHTLQHQLAAIGPMTTYAQSTAAGAMFDHMSIYEWIDRYVAGGHRSTLGAFLDVAYLDEYGADTKKQSALNLILLFGVQSDPNNFNRNGTSDERFHIRGGNQRLPAAIAATLPPETIQRGMRLAAIRHTSDGRVGLSFDGVSAERVFDQAIIAIPFSTLRGVDTSLAGFDARKQTAITTLGYGANAKLVVQFSHRLWNGRGPWPGIGNGTVETDLPFQSTWDTSSAQPGVRGLLTNFTGEAERLFAPSAPYATSLGTPSVDGYARRFTAQLDHVIPGATTAYTGRAILSVPSADPLLGGAYSYWKPGQYTAFAGYEFVRQGNVHFAGEHTSYAFQGFMEGAAETGVLAARNVLA
jgi:monoamine oxidase